MSNQLSKSQMQNIAQSLSDMGRYGDTQLVHVNKDEVELLKKIGSGTRNPQTGLLEFFGGYTSISDMFDGGGPGNSGDSYSSVDNSSRDSDGDGHISKSESGSGLKGGWDGDNDDGIFGGYTGVSDMFDGGGMGRSGDTYGHGNFSSADANNDGHISSAEAQKVGGLRGGIDGNKDSTFGMVSNVVALVANPMAYAVGAALKRGAPMVNDFFDTDKDGSMFTSGGKSFWDSEFRGSDPVVTTDSGGDGPSVSGSTSEATTSRVVDAAPPVGEQETYSEVEAPDLSTRISPVKFMEYAYVDGQSKPTTTYNGGKTPAHLSAADNSESFALAETASLAIERMVSEIPVEAQDNLQGDMSVEMTSDGQIALVMGDQATGYVETTYKNDADGYQAVMQDVAEMITFASASGDTNIDGGFAGRYRSAKQFDGYSDTLLNTELAQLRNEGSYYEAGTPLYVAHQDRLNELLDEVARREGDSGSKTAEYSTNGITRTIANSARGMMV